MTPTPLTVILRLGAAIAAFVLVTFAILTFTSGPASSQESWMQEAFSHSGHKAWGAPYRSKRQAYKRSTIEYLPVTKYVPVRKVPEHYERLDRPKHGGKRHHRAGGGDRAPFRIPAPGWGTYHADWIDKGRDKQLCLREQIPVITSEFKRGDAAAAKAGKLNWSGAVRSILGEPWTNWDEAVDRVEQCWRSGTGERSIDMHIRCRVAARPCWSIDKQLIDTKQD